MIGKILQKAKNLGSTEVYATKTEEETFIFENNKIKSENKSYLEGYGIRAINKKNKLGFSSCTKVNNEKEINNLITAVKQSQEYGAKASFNFPNKIIKSNVKVYSEELFNISAQDFIKKGREIINYCNKNVSNLRVDIYIQRKKLQIQILNTNGGEGSYQKSYVSVLVAALLTEKDGILDIYEGIANCKYNENEFFKVRQNLVDKFQLSKNKNKIQTAKYKVLFTPKAVSVLLAPLTLALNGKNIDKKVSPLCNKEGKKIFSKKLTIIDSAVEDFLPSSSPFDGEGIKSSKNILFKNGVLKNLLLDLQTAKKLNKKPTGNAQRSFSTLPFPSENNLIILGGEKSLKNILKDGEMIYIDQLIGWAGNPLGGEYSGNIGLGFLVKNGVFHYRIKDAVISGNIYQDLNKIIELSKETQWTLDGLNAPYILIDDLTVAGI